MVSIQRVGGGNLKNRTEMRKTIVCVCLMQNFKKKKQLLCDC